MIVWNDSEQNSLGRLHVPGYQDISFVIFVKRLEDDSFEWSVSLEKRNARSTQVHAWVFVDSSRHQTRLRIRSRQVAKTLGLSALTKFLAVATAANMDVLTPEEQEELRAVEAASTVPRARLNPKEVRDEFERKYSR